jgi:hypothetical protein
MLSTIGAKKFLRALTNKLKEIVDAILQMSSATILLHVGVIIDGVYDWILGSLTTYKS